MWDDKKSGRKQLFDRLNQHSGNVPGTDSYWRAKKQCFQNICFYKSYIDNEELSLFHTGSVAEFHEPWLRILLYQYMQTLKNPGISIHERNQCITDEKIYSNVVNKYKNIVTLYVSTKMEIWMALFMKNVYGVTGGMLSYEFAPSRGAIHYHCNLYADYNFLNNDHGKNLADNEIGELLKDYSSTISNEMDNVFSECYKLSPRYENEVKKLKSSQKNWNMYHRNVNTNHLLKNLKRLWRIRKFM